jgi:uncharacterized protein YjeT (DUF2065 family)
MRSAFMTWPALVLGAAGVLNGLYMLVAPEAWYHAVPTVPGTGPFNPHFVRDIGCAYIAAGASLVWLWRDAKAWPAALAGSVFFVLHALTHVWDLLAGREEPVHFAIDTVLVVIPALWGLWLSWPRERLA